VRPANLLRLLPLAALLLCRIAASSKCPAAEEESDPGMAVRAAAELLEEQHLTRKPLDDATSAEWLDAFLLRLDPRRMYFLREDYAEFSDFKTRLDDLARQGDFEFPRIVRTRYRQRVAEAAAQAEQLLAIEPDFGADDALPLSFQDYAGDRQELDERWRLRIKAQLLIEKLHEVDLADAAPLLRDRYRRIARQAAEMSDERLCQILLDALGSVYDPHSGFLSPTYISSFESTITLRTFHMGIRLQEHRGEYRIAWVNSSANAPASWLGWHLTAIVGADGSVHDLVEMHREDVYDMIRSALGPLGAVTDVTLELLNPVTFERKTVTWSRFVSKR